MTDHFFAATHPIARRAHRCIWCYSTIPAGEQYVQQEGFFEGRAQRNRYHAECWDDLLSDGPRFEFTPGCGEPPERLSHEEAIK